MSEDDKREHGESKADKKRALIEIPGEPPLYYDERFSDEDLARFASKLREQGSLLRGVVMGLILGIVGNMFVSHYYSVFSALVSKVLSENGLLFSNIVFMIVYVAFMVYIAWRTYGAVTAVEAMSNRVDAYLRKKRWEKEAKQREGVES